MSNESSDDFRMRDFDFLMGTWRVEHLRRTTRGGGDGEWRQYAGTAQTRILLGGLCNVEEHRIDGQDFGGVALRCFDRTSKTWAIYWVSERDGKLQPPVFGGFRGSVGIFEGDDRFEDRPIKVRYSWEKLTEDTAQWEQSFSWDTGRTWEANWLMKFVRVTDQD